MASSFRRGQLITICHRRIHSGDPFIRMLKFERDEPWVPATNAGMTGGVVVIQFSMTAGQSSAPGENGYAVSGVGEKEAKGCVDASSRKNAGRVVRL